MTKRKFTQEIKDQWIAALKSGEYVQGPCRLYNRVDRSHCCIGVLGEIIPGLSSTPTKDIQNPYRFLEETIGVLNCQRLYLRNDKESVNLEYPEDFPRDYSNVLPMIEALEVLKP